MCRKPEVYWLILIFIELIIAMTVYFQVWHSHCTRAKFTVLVSCLDELLTARSCPLYLPAEAVRETWERSVLLLAFVAWQYSYMGTNPLSSLQVAAIRFAACGCWTQASWHVMQRDSDILIAVSQIALYCVKISKDAGEQEFNGGIYHCSFKRGRRCLFHYSIVGNFMVYPRSNWNKLIAAIGATRNFGMVFYYHFWDQYCCWTETNILVTIFLFKFPFPSTFLLLPIPYCCFGVSKKEHEWKRSIAANKVHFLNQRSP